jgi:ABC-type bacteriocin/lantibiotic exporter with double-glycine peptidase domain
LSDDRRLPAQVDVPYVGQGEDDVGCVWACVAMIIQYYSKHEPDLPNPDIETLKDQMGYDNQGISLDGVESVNRILRGSRVSLQFSWSELAEFRTIKREIENQRPVIAWIKQNKNLPVSHSIVIKGTSNGDLRVKVNDPDDEKKAEYLTSDFMKAWDNSDRILITARIVERPTQRQIGDFT